MLLAACGGSAAAPGALATSGARGEIGSPPAPPAADRAQVLPSVPLAGGASDRLPAHSWVVSFDAQLPPAGRLGIDLGYGRGAVTLAATGDRLRVVVPDGGARVLARPPGWRGGGWWHIEATNAHLAVDGESLAVTPSRATTLGLRRAAGHPLVAALIATPAADHGLLLLHRVAELHARIPARRFPVGATTADRIMYDSHYWTTGFWAGALWQAAGIAPTGGLFTNWALTETLQHFGQEHADTHDVGFIYGQSSLAAWQALCRPGGRVDTTAAICSRLRRSVLSAADELVALAAGNPRVGTIPTSSVGPIADTIVDSTMNIAILPWASRETGDPRYARLAARHAHVVARLLVRPDGSTAQAVNFSRRTGRVLSIGTHQGLSDTSTWSRGQGWAVYGFAQVAAALRDRRLLGVALRAAGYVSRHLPAGGVPRWDYDAPAGAPVDVSAGVITADGLFYLADACRTLGRCTNPGRWVALGRRMLAASLRYARLTPPLGFLGSQILNERGRGCWCDGGELSFGLSYALEGVRLAQGTQRR